VLARVVAALVLVGSLAAVNPHIRGDGNGYYAWLASVVVDHDLDFRNQYQHADPLFAEAYVAPDGSGVAAHVTSTGRVEDQWAVGPAMMWSPWFLAAHVVVRVTGADPMDGYAPIYRRFVAIGSMTYGLLAIYFSMLIARQLGLSTRASRLAGAGFWCASPLLMYVYMLPFHAHATAAFTCALFFHYWVTRTGPMTRHEWAIWGLTFGLMGVTYHVNMVLGLVALQAALISWRAGRRASLLVDGLAFAGAAVLVGTPQWIGKAIIYGSPLATGYRDKFFWSSPRLWETLWSANHGAILWTPIIGLGLLGLIIAARRPHVRWMMAACVAFYLIIASYQNWHGLSSFGNRFFLSLTTPIIVGLSALIDRALTAARRTTTRKTVWAVSVVTVIALSLWNAGLAFQWLSKMIPNRGPVSMKQVAVQQIQVPGMAMSYGYWYFTDRQGLIREIERRDQLETGGFTNKR
jgi:hypothetical protein